MRKTFIAFLLLLGILIALSILGSFLPPMSGLWVLVGFLTLIMLFAVLYHAFQLIGWVFVHGIGALTSGFSSIVNGIDEGISGKDNEEALNSRQPPAHKELTEHVTLDHPDYVGILTKIDKKKIAEEYLAEQKKKGKHGQTKK